MGHPWVLAGRLLATVAPQGPTSAPQVPHNCPQCSHKVSIGRKFLPIDKILPIEKIHDFPEITNLNSRNIAKKELRHKREEWWMKELWTVAPYGLNDKCEGKDWTKHDDDETGCFNY